jgi:hypothetical protein
LIKSYDLNSSTKIKGISLNNSNNSKIIIDWFNFQF